MKSLIDIINESPILKKAAINGCFSNIPIVREHIRLNIEKEKQELKEKILKGVNK